MNEGLETVTIADQHVAISGFFEPRYQPVFDAFVANFRERRELGAAVAIYKDGRKAVDLWAGHLDEARQRRWEEHSIVSMASVVKGMLAFALHMLADHGKISYDEPVATYWPEFAQNGKERITVRQAISHHAALHFIDAAQPGDYFRWDRMVAAIAEQKPEWEPGTRGVYHTISIMFILGKLIQCVSGEYPWNFFRREVTEQLGVEYNLRLTDRELPLYGLDFETAHFINDASIPAEVMSRFFAGMGDAKQFTPEELQARPLQVSAGNARGGAKLFAFAAMDGELDGVRVLSPRTIELMTEVQWHEKCAVWGTPMRTALGLLLNDPEFFYIGPNPNAFGTAGGGGSFAFADRENRMSMGYSLNRWWPALALGDRARALVDAAYKSM
jgi:CubicO group peptidase (beta-lactamase class C family)